MMRKSPWRWGVAAGVLAMLVACQSAPPPPPPAQPAGLTAQQVQVLRSNGFEDEDGVWALSVPAKLLFAVDTDQLDSKQGDYVMQLARDLLQVGIRSVRVEGHTDDTGTVLYNQQLSERRAQRVADFLVRGGMDPLQVATRGWGNSKPLPHSQGARRENRRVAIIIQGPAAP